MNLNIKCANGANNEVIMKMKISFSYPESKYLQLVVGLLFVTVLYKKCYFNKC